MLIHHSFTLGQHNKPHPVTAFRRIVGRVVAILIGLFLLLFVYYSFHYDFLPKDDYSSRYIVIVAAFGLLLTWDLFGYGSTSGDEAGDEAGEKGKFPTY
jgi:hypothetical protein